MDLSILATRSIPFILILLYIPPHCFFILSDAGYPLPFRLGFDLLASVKWDALRLEAPLLWAFLHSQLFSSRGETIHAVSVALSHTYKFLDAIYISPVFCCVTLFLISNAQAGWMNSMGLVHRLDPACGIGPQARSSVVSWQRVNPQV